jgi:hypothetical protein
MVHPKRKQALIVVGGVVMSLLVVGCSSGGDAAPSATLSPSALELLTESPEPEVLGDPDAEAFCLAYFDVDSTRSAIVGDFVDEDYGSMKAAENAMRKQLRVLKREGIAAELLGTQYARIAKLSTRSLNIYRKLLKADRKGKKTKFTPQDLDVTLLRMEEQCEGFGWVLPEENLQARADAGRV